MDANAGFFCNHGYCLLCVQLDWCFLNLPDHKNHQECFLKTYIIGHRRLGWFRNLWVILVGRQVWETLTIFVTCFSVFFDSWIFSLVNPVL